MSTSWPFRFYGARPDESFEGANFGHAYEARFQRVPDADARGAIAEAWERAGNFAASVDVGGPAWRWDGDAALLRLGEDDELGIDYDEFFDEVQDLFRAVHEVAPIAEVVFLGVDGAPGRHPWQTWSEAQGPAPEPRVSPSAPIDPAFEARRKATRKALTAEAKADRPATKGLSLKPFRGEIPERKVPAAIRKAVGKQDWIGMGPGKFALVLREGRGGFGVSVASVAGVREAKPALRAPSFTIAFPADGARVWLLPDGGSEVYEVDGATGKRTTAYAGPAATIDAAGDLLVVGGPDQPLRFLDPAREYAVVEEHASPGGTWRVACARGGRVVLWARLGARASFVVFAREEGRYRVLAAADLLPDDVREGPDGVIYVQTDDRAYTLEGVDAALRAPGEGSAMLVIDDDGPLTPRL